MKKLAGRIIRGGSPLKFGKPAAWVLIISVLAAILCSYSLIDRSGGKQNDRANVESIGENGGSGSEIRNGDVNEWENIKKGTPRESVLKSMGEPDFTLSGLHGDGYVVEDGSTVVFYYGANELVYEIKRSDKPRKPIGKADVNRDGLKESIDLDQSQQDNGFVTLRIDDSNGKDIWSEQAGTSHVGWTSLFLCEQGGKDYLLRYLPGMWQGYSTYSYTLFTLEGGAEHVVRSNTIEFDVNGVNKLDALKMITFAEEVNALLGKSTLLLSSEGGDYSFGPSSADRFFERYSWLDATPELYADGDDLKTRLIKYSEYTVSNHR